MIIETSANQFYQVVEISDPALSHCWLGYPVKKLRGQFALTAAGQRAYSRGRPELVRKEASRVIVK